MQNFGWTNKEFYGIFDIGQLAVCSFTSQSLLLFVHDKRPISIGKRKTKACNKKKIKFPNQSTLLTLIRQVAPIGPSSDR